MTRFEVETDDSEALVFSIDVDCDGEINIRAYRKSRGPEDKHLIAWIEDDGVMHMAGGLDDFDGLLKLDAANGRLVTKP